MGEVKGVKEVEGDSDKPVNLKSTPGPWHAGIDPDGMPENNAPVRCASGGVAAVCWPDNDPDMDQLRANMRLIAAAPDLFLALDALVEEIIAANGDGDEEVDPIWANAKAALRKARGES